jgi:molybdenum cofactor cytidylyltransferase
VLVVVGHRAEEIAANLDGSGATPVVNPRYSEGMLTSVQAGVAAAPPETEWFVIALADQPSLEPELVEELLRETRRPDAAGALPGIVVPSIDGRRGHPLLISARFRDEIPRLDAGVGLRELMLRHPQEIRYVVVRSDSVLHDMDTPEEYRRELDRLELRSGTAAAREVQKD